MTNNNLVLRTVVGGSVIERRPVYSEDGNCIYVIQRDHVKAYSTSTGDCILQFHQDEDVIGQKDKDTIAGIAIHETYLYACTTSATLVQWSLKTGEQIRMLKQQVFKKQTGDVFDMKIIDYEHSQGKVSKPELFVMMKKRKRGEKGLFINIFSLNFKHNNQLVFKGTPDQRCVAFGGSNDDHFLATICEKEMFVYRLGSDYQLCNRYTSKDAEWTVVTAHPTEQSIAVGDSKGRVLLYTNVLDKDPNQKARTTYHWHAVSCVDIAFSPSGTDLYTGGTECVLVKWCVKRPKIRYFTARIQAPIQCIVVSPTNTNTTLSLLDNGIVIVSPQMNITRLIQKFTWGMIPVEGQKLFPAGMKYDPNSRCLVLNGRPGHVQFFSLETNELVRNVDITEMNYLTQEYRIEILNFEVTNTAFSEDGKWLATVEVRDDHETTVEIHLKLWIYNESKKSFLMNTCVDLPHYDGKVVAMRFQPIHSLDGEKRPQHMLITTGTDGKFRVWSTSYFTYGSKEEKSLAWNCDHVAYYRNLIPGPVSFSSDGSVLAVGFGPCLTIWDTESFEMSVSLTRGHEPIRHLEIEQRNHGQLVVTASDSVLQVWNLLSLTVMWSVHIAVEHLSADPLSDHMAAFTTDNQLYVFKTSVPQPVFEMKNAAKGSDVLSAIFVPQDPSVQKFNMGLPAWMQKSRLYIVTSSQELLSIELEGSETWSSLPTVTRTDEDEVMRTAFAQLLRAKQVKEFGDEADGSKDRRRLHTKHGTEVDDTVRQLLSVPLQTMPKVTLFCNSFLRSFVAETNYRGEVTKTAAESPRDENHDEESVAKAKIAKTIRNKKKKVEKKRRSKSQSPMRSKKSLKANKDSSPDERSLFFASLDENPFAGVIDKVGKKGDGSSDEGGSDEEEEDGGLLGNVNIGELLRGDISDDDEIAGERMEVCEDGSDGSETNLVDDGETSDDDSSILSVEDVR